MFKKEEYTLIVTIQIMVTIMTIGNQQPTTLSNIDLLNLKLWNVPFRELLGKHIPGREIEFISLLTPAYEDLQERFDFPRHRIKTLKKIVFDWYSEHIPPGYAIVKKHPGYGVSTAGVIIRIRTRHVIKPSLNRDGYPQVCLDNYTNRVHRHVAETYLPNPEHKKQVNHIDGNKLNTDVSNLEWCTHIENMEHAVRTKLFVSDRNKASSRGEKNNSAKITENDVIQIRTSGLTTRELSAIYGISQHSINNILSRRTWDHIA